MSTTTQLTALIAGFFAIWLVFDQTASMLNSVVGQAGLIVCAVVLAATLIVEWVLTRAGPLAMLRALGFVLPERRALLWTLAIVLAMLAFFPLFALSSGTPLALQTGWPLLGMGLFLQGGIAEEVLFRGYLFRHLRAERSFWHAAVLSALPFVAVHLVLFTTVDATLALTSLAVSLLLSFPSAWLFERGGNSVLLPALVHATVQGAIKLVIAPDAQFMSLAVAWMMVGSILPWLAFVVLRPGPARSSGIERV